MACMLWMDLTNIDIMCCVVVCCLKLYVQSWVGMLSRAFALWLPVTLYHSNVSLLLSIEQVAVSCQFISG